MKRKVAAALCLSITMAGHGVQAKGLEDLLREKGVITEDDYNSVAKSRPVNYRLGEGFTFSSPDQRFKGSIGACMQLRYTFRENEDGRDVSEFRVKRTKLYLNGNAYSPDLGYKLQMNLAEVNSTSDNNTKFLEETYLNYRFLDEAQLRFGQDKVPFARQELVSTKELQFVDRSFVTDAFKPSYDIGLMLHGKVAGGFAGYSIGVFGGAGQNTLRSTSSNAFAARVVLNPLGDMAYAEADVERSGKPLISVGANYFRDTLKATRVPASGATPATTVLESNSADARAAGSNLGFAGGNGWLNRGKDLFSRTENIDIDMAGFDAAFKWMGISAQGEYFLGQAEGKESHKKLRAHGFYTQTGYFVIPRHLELAVRYAWMDPDRDTPADLVSEVQGAVSYYFAGHYLKLQADITSTHTQPARNNDMQYRVQAQIVF